MLQNLQDREALAATVSARTSLRSANDAAQAANQISMDAARNASTTSAYHAWATAGTVGMAARSSREAALEAERFARLSEAEAGATAKALHADDPAGVQEHRQHAIRAAMDAREAADLAEEGRVKAVISASSNAEIDAERASSDVSLPRTAGWARQQRSIEAKRLEVVAEAARELADRERVADQRPLSLELERERKRNSGGVISRLKRVVRPNRGGRGGHEHKTTHRY